MTLGSFSRWAMRAAAAALVLLILFGALFFERAENMRQLMADLIAVQADAQDLVIGAYAIAEFGVGSQTFTAYEREARDVQRRMRILGKTVPGALAAAQTVDLLLRDVSRLAETTGTEGATDPSVRIRAERLRRAIEAHGVAMHAPLVGSATKVMNRRILTNKIVVGSYIAVVWLLLLGVLIVASRVNRRVGIPLRDLLAAIRAIRAGQRVIAPNKGPKDEVGEVIEAFNDLVEQGDVLQGKLDRQQETLAMAGDIARFGGWRYDAVTGRIDWSDETARTFEVEPGASPDFEQVVSYFEPEERERHAKVVADCLSEGIPYDEVFRVRTAKGRLIWSRAVGHPLRDSDGRISGAYGAFQDITELHETRLRAEREAWIAAAAQKQESLGKLTSGIAHDFNNLLAVILASLDRLQEDETDPERTAVSQTAIEATLRGAELTRNMLAFARRAPLTEEVLDLNDVVRSVRQLAARTVPASVEIETSLLAGLWKIRADRASTESALLNLIVNADHAMQSLGRMTIETTNLRVEDEYVVARGEDIPKGRYVMLAVSDTGPGIPPDILERIFEPFFSTKGPQGGTGLGLSMVQGFLKQTGGTVRVYSEPGVGTTFKLFFPALLESDELAPEVRDTPRTLPGMGQRILLVEDESDVLKAFTRALERAGYAVVGANTGDKALTIFEADPAFDLVVTDIVMPGQLQGPALVKKLRVVRPDLPAVFMSGYAEEATVHGNGLRQSDIRLMKPVQRKPFLLAVERALAGVVRPQRY